MLSWPSLVVRITWAGGDLVHCSELLGRKNCNHIIYWKAHPQTDALHAAQVQSSLASSGQGAHVEGDGKDQSPRTQCQSRQTTVTSMV